MCRWVKALISKLKQSRGKNNEQPITQEVPRQAAQPSWKPAITLTQGPVQPSSRMDRKVALLIGLDFGTHSTKVVVRRRGEREGHVLSLDSPSTGYPEYAIPSLVRVTDGKVWFGGEALNSQGGTLHRLLKLQLIKTGPLIESERHITDMLVTAYFAWVLGAVRQWAESEFGLTNAKLFLNVAAPMDHFEVEQIKARYLAIVGTAWEWTFGSTPHSAYQGVPLNDLVAWIEEEEVIVPEAAVRQYDVLPETIAPIVSLSQDPRMSAGMYLLIDMGAGTTEMSVNFVSVPGGKQNVLCYFDKSIQLGAERFLNGENPKELITALLRNSWQTWCHGYEKDAQNQAARQRWKSLRILLLGGGTCRKDVRDAIKAERHAIFTRFPGEAKCEILRHEPADLRFSSPSVSSEDITLASVANGLAFPRMQWPTFYEPARVEPIGATGVQTAPEPWYLDR